MKKAEVKSNYYSQTRSEIIKFIPPTSKTILDVGTGEGEFGYSLKKELDVEVWGIELNQNAYNKAKIRLDKVFYGKFEDVYTQIPYNHFDVIVFNDVLEHMVDPFQVLECSKKLVREKGIVVASIPNVRFWGNLKGLLKNKDWKYMDGGILDITHLRFFTKKSMIRLFEDAGYLIHKIEGINPTKSKNLKIFNFLFCGNLSDAKYSQYVCVAKPNN